jgi:RNA polymerase sigma-70 factor (ECF subfamily)
LVGVPAADAASSVVGTGATADAVRVSGVTSPAPEIANRSGVTDVLPREPDLRAAAPTGATACVTDHEQHGSHLATVESVAVVTTTLAATDSVRASRYPMAPPRATALPFSHVTPAELDAFRRREPGAVRALYRGYGRLVYAVAYRVLGRRDLAEDAVQETFVRAWQAAGTFDVEREPAAWLATIAKRAAIDIYRRESRRPASDIVDLAADDPAVVTLPPDLGTVDAVWQVRNAIERLSPDEADIIRMHHLEGMTHTQISQQLGVALGTVKSRSHRAHARLATLLGHLKETVA